MLGKISRLFGGQLDDDTERDCSSKRQEGDGWTASSSKKVRVEAVEMALTRRMIRTWWSLKRN